MGEKLNVGLIGGTLVTKSISLREDNAEVEPTYFNWIEGAGDGSSVFVMDSAADSTHSRDQIQQKKKVALLVEPRALRPENYEFAEQNFNLFSHVLTYNRQLLKAIPNGLFYPLGGSSIAFEHWGMYRKSKDICMIVSEKNTTPGHQLRHEIVDRFEGRIDFFGSGVGRPFARKFDILKDYKYCVVVESDTAQDYFSEKLIDAVSVGCVPLHYCQRDNYSNVYFMKHHFTDIEGLEDLLILIRNHMLYWDEGSTKHNLDIATRFRIAEDFIFEVHKELFQ